MFSELKGWLSHVLVASVIAATVAQASTPVAAVTTGAVAKNGAAVTIGAVVTTGTAPEAPTRSEVRAVTELLRHDPNLGGDHKIRSLRWIGGASQPPPNSPTWMSDFLRYLEQGADLLVWPAGAAAIAIAAVALYRWLKVKPRMTLPNRPLPATHLGGMDIRATSLPDDVGTSALALANNGDARAALSLLYRASLARAVHTYGVAIAASDTEKEALRAVDARLDATRARYFDELVEVRQRAVYAGEMAASESVTDLCLRFERALQ